MRRSLFVVTAALVVAALLFLTGFSAGRAVGPHVDQYLVSALRSVGLEQYSTLIRGAPATSLEDVPLTPEERERFRIFWEAWGWIEEEFYDRDKIDHQKMIYGAVQGLLQSLDDPHTVFLDPEHRAINEAELRGSFGGIGVQVDLVDGLLRVISPLEGSPGERAGLRPGDMITHVDGTSIEGMSLLQAVLLIRGDKDTSVDLTVRREGVAEPLTFTIVREDIRLQPVRWRMLEDDIAYVRIVSFTDIAPADAKTALEEALGQGARALVLDLRHNPGGFLHTAVEVSSLFLSEGVVLYQEDGSGERRTYEVKPMGLTVSLPMVVLVNRGSASASEIVAGTLQTHGRALLFGEPTYGKGTVQNIHELSDGSSVRITVAQWLTSDEVPLAGEGLQPDVVVEFDGPMAREGEPDPQLEAAVDHLLREMR